MRYDDHGTLQLIGAAQVSILGDTGTKYGGRYPCRMYDDGFGPVWVYRDAGGLIGIVRARSWEDAYDICQDVIFDDADPSDLVEYMAGGQDAELPEGYGYRPNGGDPQLPHAQTGIYCEDLNGSCLDLLSARIAEDLRIVLTWETYDHVAESAAGAGVARV